MAKISHLRKDRIEEALKILDQAVEETRDDISGLMKDKVQDIEHSFSKGFSNVTKKASETFQNGKKAVVDSYEAVDESVHANPWMYIGGTALVGLAAGFLLGRKK